MMIIAATIAAAATTTTAANQLIRRRQQQQQHQQSNSHSNDSINNNNSKATYTTTTAATTSEKKFTQQRQHQHQNRIGLIIKQNAIVIRYFPYSFQFKIAQLLVPLYSPMLFSYWMRPLPFDLGRCGFVVLLQNNFYHNALYIHHTCTTHAPNNGGTFTVHALYKHRRCTIQSTIHAPHMHCTSLYSYK